MREIPSGSQIGGKREGDGEESLGDHSEKGKDFKYQIEEIVLDSDSEDMSIIFLKLVQSEIFEENVSRTFLFTSLNSSRICFWGKKFLVSWPVDNFVYDKNYQ